LQAHLQRAKLPISDYVNDTKGVTENVPRLLAAMQFIALGDSTTSGALDLVCQFARTKQYLATMTLPNDDAMVQLPGVSSDTADRLLKNKAANIKSLRDLRSLDRNSAAEALQRVLRGKKGVLDIALNHLFALPTFSVARANVYHVIDKQSGESRGHLKVSLEFQSEEALNQRKIRRDSDASTFTLVLLVGSYTQGMLLAEAAVSVAKSGQGTWTVSKELEFDWKTAAADGGEDQQIVLRLLWEEIRGFDAEMIIPFM